MVRVVWVALLVAVAGCGGERSAPRRITPSKTVAANPQPQTTSREVLRSLLQRVRAGMTEDEVRGLLGAPDGIRHPGGTPWPVGVHFIWAYGARHKGAFASVGLVEFESSRRVRGTRSPVEGFRADEAIFPALGREPQSVDGLRCGLELLSHSEDEIVARLTLTNKGSTAFRHRHDHTGIRSNTVVELLDDAGEVLFRFDTMMLHSPYESDREKWPVMEIPAGEQRAEDVGLGYLLREFGALPGGSYTLRAAFPLEKGRRVLCNRVTFRVMQER